MALSARLDLRPSQSLVMTPQLLQSIRLLQFNHAELQRFVDEQIERNPLLERAEDGSDAATSDPTEAAVGDDLSASAMAERLDTSLENVFPDDPGRSDGPARAGGHRSDPLPALPSSGAGDHDWSLDDLPGPGVSLRQIIGEQIALAITDPADRTIAAELADRLDDRGYLDADPAVVATRLGASAGDGERVLARLQSFDPPGIFARNLSECLRLQCARRDRLDPAMGVLLDHLDLLARRDFDQLSRLCGVDQSDLLDMLSEIRRLDPHPGGAYEFGPTQSIVHDVELRRGPDGTWQIELNSDALPRVLVDRAYHATITSGALDEREKSFMTQCLQDAHWLERSLDQRANTILKVAAEIVRQQDGFFAHGVSALRPLTMKAVADEISMHESTVSRVVSNKYMLTPRGLFELRYFFTGAIAGTAGSADGHSAESVRQRIRALIDGESPQKVLSDDALVARLQDEGVDIARRTVAKYREAMSIASSVQRRREKRARAMAEV